ncbi:MAG: hypothetical protein J5I92_11435 [Thiogranum sp.]|nr:hypothetical protein [Thiogranum sp.]
MDIINLEHKNGNTLENDWRFQYRLRPYLGNAGYGELKSRLDDVLRNVLNFTPEAKIGLVPPEQGGSLWAQKLVDLQVECFRRNTAIESLADMASMPWNKEALELVRRNHHLAPHCARKDILCKFGSARWMQELLEHGRLRLSPASYYSGEEHNVARQDNELVLRTYITPYDYDLGIIKGTFKDMCPTRGWGVVEHSKPSDHYIYCLTGSFNPRYHFDFGGSDGIADACVIIRDPREFERRLVKSARQALKGWSIATGMVRYVDPYFLLTLLPASSEEIYFFKPFRFLYQREFRLVGVPPPDLIGPFRHLSLNLGCLEDIAELVHVAS